MAEYLKLYKNQAAYDEESDKPVIGHMIDDVKVKIKEYDPYAGHEYVEIGGLKWATMNIGASQPTDYGLYFQWGDTQGYTAEQVGSGAGQKYFGWADYKYSNDDGSVMTKYNETDGKTVLEAIDDAAANWGGSWRMPTTAEFQALSSAVYTEWTRVNNVRGMLCTDNTDSSKTLFFPAAGSCYDGRLDGARSECFYWSSSLSLNMDDRQRAISLYLYYNSRDEDIRWLYNIAYRYYGYPVRLVAS